MSSGGSGAAAAASPENAHPLARSTSASTRATLSRSSMASGRKRTSPKSSTTCTDSWRRSSLDRCVRSRAWRNTTCSTACHDTAFAASWPVAYGDCTSESIVNLTCTQNSLLVRANVASGFAFHSMRHSCPIARLAQAAAEFAEALAEAVVAHRADEAARVLNLRVEVQVERELPV